MPNCLGIYVGENLIKYAKISKEHDDVKVEAFGIKFYDNLEETFKQIINETFSYKTPISINITDENYTTANLFNLLNKKYFEKAVQTEFEIFCNDNAKNKNAIEMRYIESENLEDTDKTKIIYSYCNKSSIVTKAQLAGGNRLDGIFPLPISIANLAKLKNSQNTAIINIEEKTSITTVANGKIQKIDLIDLGMKDILHQINTKENSYLKSYNICKNSTIYTLGSQNLQIEENDYMDDIMPTLHSIIERTKEIFIDNGIKIENIYLTGLATAINNLDLYFQENFPDKTCEVLAPYFANKSNLKLNIKDYIEVNSAIALALQALEPENKEINFKKQNGFEEISKALMKDSNKNKQKEPKPKKERKERKKIELTKTIDIIEKNTTRFLLGVSLVIIVYIALDKIIINSINRKQTQLKDIIDDTNTKIASIQSSTQIINTRASDYRSLIDKINEANDKITQTYARKNAIPNFLTQIMFNMPKNVQLVSIQNQQGKAITIVARAEKYEQIGYLKATLKNSGILTGITSTSGVKQDGVIEVTINGNLPY